MKRSSLAAIGAVLAVIALSGCSDEPGDTEPSPAATTAAGPATESPADPSPSQSAPETIPADEVTAAQKKACLDAIIEQIRAKKGGNKPEECAILPNDVLGQIIEQALSGG